MEALEPPQNGENEAFDSAKVPYYREMAKLVEALVRAMDHPRDRAIIHLASATTKEQVLNDAGIRSKEKSEPEGMPIRSPSLDGRIGHSSYSPGPPRLSRAV